ncbi:MAG TPA: serine/threonine dehydratase [Pseudonocardiaceae bacterium]
MLVHLSDVEAAAALVAGHVRRTPTIEVAAGDLAAAPLVLKLEHLQRSGSFKARGAFHVLLRTRPERVVTASGGNHGLAVATAARALGIPAEVYVPTTTPATKLDGLHALGAEVRPVGTVYAEAAAEAHAHATAAGLPYLHAYDDPMVVAGQGTLALELPDVDTVLVAVGGGGLAGGLVAGLAGRARVVCVEPRNCPTLHAALAAGEPVDVDVSGVAVDALGARRVGAVPVALLRDVSSLLVTDEAIAEARAALWRELRLAVEPAAGAALAALRTGGYRPDPGERVAVVICGGNAAR